MRSNEQVRTVNVEYATIADGWEGDLIEGVVGEIIEPDNIDTPKDTPDAPQKGYSREDLTDIGRGVIDTGREKLANMRERASGFMGDSLKTLTNKSKENIALAVGATYAGASIAREAYDNTIARADLARNAALDGVDRFGDRVDDGIDAVAEGVGRAYRWSANKISESIAKGKDWISEKKQEAILKREQKALAKKQKREEAILTKGAEKAHDRRDREDRADDRAERQENREGRATDRKESSDTMDNRGSLRKQRSEEYKFINRNQETVDKRSQELVGKQAQLERAILEKEKADRDLKEAVERHKEALAARTKVKNKKEYRRASKDIAKIEIELGQAKVNAIDALDAFEDRQSDVDRVSEHIADINKGIEDAADRLIAISDQAKVNKSERSRMRKEARADFWEAAKDRVGKLVDSSPKFLRKAGSYLVNSIRSRRNGSPKRAAEGLAEPTDVAPRRAA